MDERHEWIKRRSYEIWKRKGKPTGKDLDCWLEAEKEYDYCWQGQLCCLTPGSCPHQQCLPTTGGKHIAICLQKKLKCKNKSRYTNCYGKRQKRSEFASELV